MEVKPKDILKLLEEHHNTPSKEIGDQLIGDCLFCGKPEHLYMNKEKGLWDCKVCGSKGNLENYLYQLGIHYHKNLYHPKNILKLKALSADRGLPVNAFKNWLVGWDDIGKRYTIPVLVGTNSCSDIRIYKIGMKTRSSSGSKTGLINIHKIEDKKPIYVCEGEWDGMALDWLLKKLELEATVVAVPGANTFKKEWIPSFRNCKVQLLYDNDSAGEQAEIKVQPLLSGTVRSIGYLNWLSGLSTGFDVRDWIKYGIKVSKLRGCWKNLQKMFVANPRISKIDTLVSLETEEEKLKENLKVDIEKEMLIYRRWMHLPDPYVLDIIFGTIFANLLMSGDPIWMFLIAPPGGSKSELLMSLIKCQSVVCLTSLTPHSLISGFSWGTDKKDPSLLPQLDGKVLVLKDFTTITSMHFTARDEIFGILRDAYDGKTEKQFGTGIRREYKSKFGILAGTTPVIDTFSTIHQSLGERFLKYRIEIDSKDTEEKKILQAISNINNEVTMRGELQDAAARIVSKENLEDLPIFPEKYLKRVTSLAQFCARMRGVVLRDNYTQQVLYRASTEVGTRLAKQLMKLGIGIGIFRGKKELGDYECNCVSRVAMHTCPERLVSIVKAIYRSRMEDGIEELKTKDIANYSRLPISTVFRLLEDLYLLKVVKRQGEGSKFYWGLESHILKLIETSKIFG